MPGQLSALYNSQNKAEQKQADETILRFIDIPYYRDFQENLQLLFDISKNCSEQVKDKLWQHIFTQSRNDHNKRDQTISHYCNEDESRRGEIFKYFIKYYQYYREHLQGNFFNFISQDSTPPTAAQLRKMLADPQQARNLIRSYADILCLAMFYRNTLEDLREVFIKDEQLWEKVMNSSKAVLTICHEVPEYLTRVITRLIFQKDYRESLIKTSEDLSDLMFYDYTHDRIFKSVIENKPLITSIFTDSKSLIAFRHHFRWDEYTPAIIRILLSDEAAMRKILATADDVNKLCNAFPGFAFEFNCYAEKFRTTKAFVAC